MPVTPGRISTRALLVGAALARVAHAEPAVAVGVDEVAAPAALASAPAADGVFTPGLAHAANHGQGLAVVSTTYNRVSRTTAVDLAGEVTVWGPVRLVLRVDSAFDHGKPGIGAAVQWLDEAKHGVASSAYLVYRAEGFTEAEGELEALVSFGKRLGPVRGTLNLAYGQDPEGNERDGEAAVALHVEPASGLYTGLVGRFRDALGSNGDKATGVLRDFLTGANATYAFGRFGVSATAGLTGVKTVTSGSLDTGFAAALSVGSVF